MSYDNDIFNKLGGSIFDSLKVTEEPHNKNNRNNNNHQNSNNNYKGDNKNGHNNNRNEKYNKGDSKPNHQDRNPSHNIRIGKYFAGTSYPKELDDYGIKRLAEGEYKQFIENYKTAYKRNPNNMPFYFSNAMRNNVFMEAFVDVALDDEEVDKDTLNLILSKYLMDNIRREDEFIEKLKKKYKKLNKKYIKSITKVLDLDKSVSIDVALAVPRTGLPIGYSQINALEAILNVYSKELIDKYSIIDGEDDIDYTKLTKVISKLIKVVFPEEKDLNFVISTFMLNKKYVYHKLGANSKVIFNRITYMCLEYLNDLDKKSLYEFLKSYGRRRKGNDEIERRIKILSHINPEDYSKILKAANKLVKEDSEYKRLLD